MLVYVLDNIQVCELNIWENYLGVIYIKYFFLHCKEMPTIRSQ